MCQFELGFISKLVKHSSLCTLRKWL